MPRKLYSIPCMVLIIGLTVSTGSPRETTDWYQKGLFFNRSGRYDKAIDAFTRAIAGDPGHANAYNNRGAVWYLKQELEKAAGDYTRAIELEPDKATFYINRGAVWFKLADYKKTIRDYNRAIALDPQSDTAYNNRGMTWYFMAAYDRAVDDHTRAIQINPEVHEYYNNRGAAWFRKEKHERAVVDYTRAVILGEKPFNALKNRGIAWFKMGFYNRAIADFTLALGAGRKAADVYVFRGIAYYQQGLYNKALVDFVDAVTAAPENADACNQLAWMLAVCPDSDYRNGEKAVEMAQKAVKLFPSLNTLDTLAAAYAEAGDFKAAVAQQERLMAAAKDESSSMPVEYLKKLDAYKQETPWRAARVHREKKEKRFPQQKQIVVQRGNIRSEPGISSFIVEKFKRGTRLSVVGKDGQWYLVEMAENQFGWAFETLFETDVAGPLQARSTVRQHDPIQPMPNISIIQADSPLVEVRVDVGRIRKAPSAASPILYRVVKGNRLVLMEKKDDWYRVSLGKDKTGWGHMSLFLPKP